MIKFTVVVVALFGSSFADIELWDHPEKPLEMLDQPGCYVADLNKVIPVGSSSKLRDPCMQYVCQEEHLVIETCPEITKEVDPEHISVDNTHPYPACCPKITTGFLKKHEEL